MTFLERTLSLIERDNITKNKLLTELGLSKNCFVKWQSGSMPGADVVSKIARYFNVSVDYLLGRTDNPDVNYLSKTAKKVKCTPHIIAYFDLLGVANATMNPDTSSKLVDALHFIYTSIEAFLPQILLRHKQEIPYLKNLKYKIFSDNVVLAVEYRKVEHGAIGNILVGLTDILARLQFDVLSKLKLLMRGAICDGDLYIDDTFVIGPGLVKAYSIENSEALYPRIILEKSLAKYIVNKSMVEDKYDKLVVYNKLEPGPKYYLNYLLYAKDATEWNTVCKAVTNNEHLDNAKITQKINWVKYYHNAFCKSQGIDEKYLFEEVTPADFAPIAQASSAKIKKLERTFATIRYYDIPVSAGTGQYLDDEHYIMLSLTEQPPAKADFVIRVCGNSMEPTYKDGDKLYIEATNHIEEGEIGIFSVNGESFIKELGKGKLISHNDSYAPILFQNNDTIHCFGRVLERCQNYR